MKYRGSIEYPINREGEDERIIRVEYVYWPACRGMFERGGCQITPDEPAEVEITSSVDIATSQEVELTEEEEEGVWDAVGEKQAEDNREYERED